jgi:hypothetical protein
MHPTIQLEAVRQRQADVDRNVRHAHHLAELRAAESDTDTPRRRARRRAAVLAVAGLLGLALAPHAFAGSTVEPSFPSHALPVHTAAVTPAGCRWMALSHQHLPAGCSRYLHHSGTCSGSEASSRSALVLRATSVLPQVVCAL